jgi:hypothetical protein
MKGRMALARFAQDDQIASPTPDRDFFLRAPIVPEKWGNL